MSIVSIFLNGFLFQPDLILCFTSAVDEFIQMLLTFPVEPGTAARGDVLEIISDSVYANSSTLDGKRFALEFYTKRKADAQIRVTAAATGKATAKVTSLADSESGLRARIFCVG